MTAQSQAADFWDNPKEAESFLKKLSAVKYWVTTIDNIRKEMDDYAVLEMMAQEEVEHGGENQMQEELEGQLHKINGMLEELETRSMLGEEGDNLGALLKINSGAGGTESNDWSAMLLRMYTRWGDRKSVV